MTASHTRPFTLISKGLSMNSDIETRLLQLTLTHDWTAVMGMPIENRPDILLDFVVFTTNGAVSFSGKAHQLPDGDEAFSLAVFQHQNQGWWQQSEDVAATWKPRELTRELSCLMRGEKSLSLFADPRLSECRYPMPLLLDTCTAMSFSDPNDPRRSLVVCACDDFPCAMRFTTNPEEKERLLNELIPIEKLSLLSRICG